MIRLKNNKRIYAIWSIAAILTLGLTACTSSQNKTTTNSNEPSMEQKNLEENKPSVGKNSGNNNSAEIIDKSKFTNTKNDYIPELAKQQLEKGSKPTFNTTWKSSTNGSFSACIEGKGQEAVEEGVGKIFVKDNNDNIFSFEISNNNKISPLSIEWFDNKDLLVVIGSAHGTVSKGGNLYLLDVSTGKLSSILQIPDKKQQIMTAKKSGNNISLKVNVYEDENYNKSHIENWTIYSVDTNLSKPMEVKNSEGKLLYVINGANQ